MVSSASSDSTAMAWSGDSVPNYTAIFSLKPSMIMKTVRCTFSHLCYKNYKNWVVAIWLLIGQLSVVLKGL